ncbi:MAG: hypothetical protein EHM61_07835, partial [Acidobacteria bacterium]
MHHKILFRLLAFVLLAFVFLLAPAPQVYAGGVVSVCDEAHLRAALFDGGTVTFSCSGTITLANQLVIQNHTMIDGAGQSVTISGGGKVRVFWITGSSTLPLTFNLRNITVANGYADFGGGMRLNPHSNSTTLTNVTFTGNHATYHGGGIYVDSDSSPTLSNVTVTGNSADWGGGMFNAEYTSPTLTDVTFTGNSASSCGGGMSSYNVRHVSQCARLTNVTFNGNSAVLGGGMDNTHSSPILTNVTFSGNTAGSGGAMLNNEGSNALLRNVTFNGNTVTGYGRAMFNYHSYPHIWNSILWGDTGGEAEVYTVGELPVAITAITDSVVQGGCPPDTICTRVTSADPLLGSLGNYGGSTQTIPLLPGSSAINLGNAAYCTLGHDQRGLSQVGPCDLGAFESQGFTLGSLTGNSQQTDINTAFAQPLGLTVTANNASEPVIGGKVTFTPPGSGPSAAITGSPATIGAGGGASVTATANGIASWYVVTASASGASDAQYHLMNLWDLNVALTSSPNPSGQGQPVTFAATVTSASGPTPTGTVQFHADGTPLGPEVTLSSGQASVNTSALALGTHQITAAYSGDTSFRSGTSAPYTQTVNLASIMYARPGGATSGYCENWENVCELSYALASSAAGQEIWVRAGAYKPTTTDPDPRKGTFQLKNGVAVYGGFNGTESTRNQRNPTTNVVILSGDLNGDDAGFTNNGENSYHVVTGANGATLDGVTISGGNANEVLYPDDRGGGMYNSSSSPTLANVTFSGNNAQWFGGGMCNFSGSNPALTSVTFSGNSAVWAGGGMYNDFSNPTLMNVTFTGNSSEYGGGLRNSSSSPTLTNVTFNNNLASWGGGGMWNSTSSNPTLTNVAFNGNSSLQHGGGMYNSSSASPTLTGVTFSGNSATYNGGGMYNTI